MRTPRLAPSLVVKILAGTLLAACAVIAACSGSNGVDSDCKFNVTANGIEASTDGCEQFAPCLDAKGNVQAAAKCCVEKVDGKDVPLTGAALATCLFGYGAGPAPTSSASSSSSSGGGGAGTGGAGTGGAGTGGAGTGGAGGGS